MRRARGALVAALALTLVASAGVGYVRTEERPSEPETVSQDEPGLLERAGSAARNLVAGGKTAARPEPVSAGLAVDERPPAARKWPAQKRVREVTAGRTANGRVFQLSDGRLQAEISPGPVNYRDHKGRWQPIDTTVVDRRNTTNTFTSEFGARSDGLVTFSKDGRSIELGLAGAPKKAEPRVSGSTVTYPGLAAGADVVYEVTPTELKEKIVLAKPPAGAASYTFSMDTGGLTPVPRPDGSIAFADAGGATVLTMPAPFMYDASGAHSTAVTQKVSGATITVTADTAWLADPARKYPVVVDPTIKVQPVPTDAQDAMISSGAPTTNYGSSYELRVGTDATAAWRSLLRFDTGMVPAGTTIDDAQLQLYYDSSYYAYGHDVPMEARKITTAWSESSATWATMNANITAEPVGNIVTVDDGDAGTAAVGTWTSSTNTALTPKAIGGDYRVNNDATTGHTHTWVPTITEAGDYLVEVHYVGEADRASNAPYTVHYNGGSKTYPVDQTTPVAAGGWKTLGVHPFAAGTTGKVVLGDVASKAVIADAVRFTKATTVKPNSRSSVWSSFPVRNVVQEWVNGAANNGLMVKAVNEADKGRGGAIFQASEYAYNNARRDANLPKLVVTYGKPAVAVNQPTTITSTGALLNWPAYTGTDIAEYQVHRSVYQNWTPSAATLVAPVAKGTTSFQDTTASPTPAAETDIMKRKFFYYMVAVKTTDGKIIAGPTVPAMLPKAGQITKIFRTGVTDTTLSDAQKTVNVNSYAGDPYISPGNNSSVYGDTRGLVRFPVSGVPSNAQIIDAQLRMWNVGLYPGTDTDEHVDVHRLTSAFDQTKATWNTSDGVTAWNGGAYDATALSGNNGFTNDPKWMTWDVTGAAKAWVAAPASNFGLLLKQRDEVGQTARAMLLSAEAPEPMLRPTLEVTYLEQTPESTYYAPQLPEGAPPATTFTTPVSVSNPTPTAWKAADWQLSYRWARANGEPVSGSTAVTALPADVPSGGTVDLTATVTTPPSTTEGNKKTDYTISWELQNKATGQALQQSASIAPLAQKLAVVEPTSDQLGLEDFYSYAGKNTGAGGSLMNNLYAGNTVWQYNAFSNPSRGLSSFVRLAYNSLDTSDTVSGYGWSLQASSMMRLGSPLDFHPNPKPTRVTFTDGDGTSHWFTLDSATNTWVSPKGVHLYLQQKAGVECKPNTQEPRAWSLTRPDRTQFFYDCEGYLTATVDKNGNTMLFTYEERKSNNAPTKFLRYVTDPESRQTITIDYWAKGENFEYIDDTTWTRASGTGLTNPKIIDHVKTIRDISGRTLYFTYTDKGLLGELIDGYGSTDGAPKTFRFQYDMTQGNKNVKLVKVTDPRGNSTSLVYNYPSAGDDPQWHWRTKSYTDRLGGLTQFAYTDPDGPQGANIDTVVTDAENNKTAYNHDGYGRAYQVTNAKSEVTKLVWDDQHNVVSLTEANGAVSTWRYDAKTGYPLEIKDALAVKNNYPGTVLTYQTQLNGHVADLATKTSPEGRKHSFTYTTEGDLATVTDPIGAVSTNTWDTWGRLMEAKDANGNPTKFDDYHPSGYPRLITDAENAETYSVYDDRGNVIELKNDKLAKTTQGYDTFGRPKDMVQPVDAAKNRFLTTKASVYDANDNIVTAYAPNGTSTTAVYDKADQVTEVVAPMDEPTDPERRTITTYDRVGNVVTETEPQGNLTSTAGDYTTTTKYDAIYQMIEIVNSKGQKVTSTYDNVGNLLTIVDAKKNATADTTDFTTKYEYDLAHRVVKTTDAAGRFTTARYDRDGLSTGITDAEGNEALATYNPRGELVESKVPHSKDASGAITYRTTKYAYDAVGNQTKVITPRGVATSNEEDFTATTVYDALNRVKEVWSPYSPTDSRYNKPDKTIYTYDSVGNVAKISAPPSEGQSVRNETTYEYFDNGWQKSSADPWGIVSSYEYNDLGQQIKNTLTSAGGSVTRTMTWDFYPSGNQRARSDDGVPVGKDVVLVDSSDSHNTASQGSWTGGAATGQYGYDVYTAPAGGGAAQFNWQLNIPRDGTYQVFAYYPQVSGAATDAEFTVTHAGGSAVKTVDQTKNTGAWVSLGSYTFTEDAPQKVTLTDRATGKVVADAIKLVRDSGSETDDEKKEFTYRYNPNGLMTEVKDLSPGAKVDTYRIDYDDLNQISKVEEVAAGTVKNTTALTYDENGNPLTSKHDLTWSKIEYDVRDMVAKVTNADSPTAGNQQISTFTYTARGQLLKQVKPNGNTVDLEYYLDSAVQHQVEKTSAGTVVAEHTLEYGANGTPSKDVLKLMNADNSADYIDNTYTFDYDPQDRITQLTKTGDSSATEAYVYDANSNVVSQTVDGVTSTNKYDRNRLHSSSAGGVTSTYNYDPLGRLDTVSIGGERAQKHYYDGFDRTVKTTAGTGAAAESTTYVYDPFDRTVSQTTAGKTTAFTYLGMNNQVLREEIAGKADKSYQYSPWGQQLTQIKHKDGGTKEYSQYTYRPRGDVIAITKDDGKTRATYGYTAYGKDDKAQFTGEDKPGSGGEGEEEPYNAFRFNASRWDAASGTYDMGFRNYDPGLNRFLTRDYYGGALSDMGLAKDPFLNNRYSFAGGNPISFVELDGHLFGMSWSDLGHAALDVVGMVPVVGEVADVANGIWYMAEGNYTDGAMSLASAIPGVGNAVTAAKWGKKAYNTVDAVAGGAKTVDNAVDGAKAADNVADASKAAPSTPAPPKANAPKGCNSFVPGTRVMLAGGGTKAIEDLQLGDEVLATDVETGENQARPVSDVRSHAGVKKLVTITVDSDGAAGSKTGSFTSTAAHLFWLPDVGRWVEGADLKPGMWLQTGSGTWVEISAIKRHTRSERVHNLTIEGQHNYYILAGDTGLLVHNCDGPNCKCGPSAKELKNTPGTATGTGRNVGSRWIRGSEGNAGVFPKQVADRLRGQQFESFDKFREAFWKEVANDPTLTAGFKKSAITRMKKGRSPFVRKWQKHGNRTYELHHVHPVQHGGGVYDMDNLVVVTPRFHKQILDPRYHFGNG